MCRLLLLFRDSKEERYRSRNRLKLEALLQATADELYVKQLNVRGLRNNTRTDEKHR